MVSPFLTTRSDLAPILAELQQVETFLDLEVTASVNDIYSMMLKSPIAGKSAETRADIMAENLGQYMHPEQDVQDFVRAELGKLDTGFHDLMRDIGYMLIVYGYAVIQPLFRRRLGDLQFVGLNILDPRYIDFKGNLKDPVSKVIFYGVSKQHQIDVRRLIHLSTSPIGRPDGLPMGLRAISYYRASVLNMNLWAVAARTNATPLLVGRAKPVSGKTDVLIDEHGRPVLSNGKPVKITSSASMNRRLENVRTSSYITVLEGEDVKSIDIQADPELFAELADYLDQGIAMAFGVPITLIKPARSGGGDSNLAKTQLEVLRSQTAAMALQIERSMLRRVIGPLIRDRFPSEDNPGMFFREARNIELDIMRAEAILSALQSGQLPEDKVEPLQAELARLLMV